ncbi:MAG: hypothetical protein C0392_02695 [Syntrophus sp. (in: bacteria)]|nr:hypothetical protein [Syntrophus sp. (in: bacteria)]
MSSIINNRGYDPTEAGPIKYRTGLHWVIVLGPALLMGLAGISIPSKGTNAFMLLVAATIWGILASISLRTSEILLTRDRILSKIGFPWRRSHDFPYENITGVDIYQPTLGKILDFGKVTILLEGRKKKSFRMVNAPLTFKKELSLYRQELLERGDQKE